MTFQLFGTQALAESIVVAVASNFYKPAQMLAKEFSQQTGHKVQLSTGSTGALYAQIRNGAPYDVFLAADQLRPELLVNHGLALAETRTTYAQGLLVLWSPRDGVTSKDLKQLDKIALANPKNAPYGAAAVEVMQKTNFHPQLIEGKSISQAYQFVASGAVVGGFVAMSQVTEHGELLKGSAWMIPDDLYSSINQDAVLLSHGHRKNAARQWLQFLGSESARAMIQKFGYKVPK